MADLIKKTDDLNTGREKLNEAIKQSERAENKSDEALNKADQSISMSESTQEQLNQVVIQGDSSVEAAQARVNADNTKTYNTLKERLDTEHTQVTSQLADTEQELQNLDNKKMNKDTNDISVLQINKNKGKLDQTYMSDEFLQQIVGTAPINAVPAYRSITNEKVADKAISVETVDFVHKTKNLFNKDAIIMNGAISPYTGEAFDADGYGYVDYFRVEPDTEYHRSYYSAAVAFYDSNMEFISGATSGRGTVTSPPNAHVARLSIFASNPNNLNGFQFEKGNSETEYEPYELEIPNLKMVFKGFNSYIVSQTGGFTIDFKNKEIRTRSFSTHIIVNGERYNFLDKAYSFADLTFDNTIIVFDVNTKDINFISATNADSISYDRCGVLGVMRINEETVFVNGETIDIIRTARHSDHRIILLGDDYSDYTVTEKSFTPSHRTNPQAIYDVYDNLMIENPDYISKRELARTVNDNPIYLYEFKEPNVYSSSDGFEYSQPKILYIGGIHGHEKIAVDSDVVFFRDLCEDWTNQNSLRFIRSNAHIMFVPIVNPDGYELKQRTNGNGVDIARNFPVRWGEHPEDNTPGSPYYGGSSPASEIETNVIMQLLEEDPYFSFEHHNAPALEETGELSWMGSTIPLIRKIVAAFGLSWTMKIKKDFPVLRGEGNLINPSYYAKAGTMTAYIQSIGVSGVILETAISMGTSDDDIKRVTADIIGNIILSVLRSHNYLS